MKVINIHQREMGYQPENVGALIDSLASHRDLLWPAHIWPKMEFDRPLATGAVGGHGPIRYRVEEYLPGKSVKFRFTGPKGFDGYHSYEIITRPGEPVILRHSVRMNTHGLAVLSWPLLFEPMHNALIEDSFTKAQVSLGQSGEIKPWSRWVKILRWFVSGGKAAPQIALNKANSSYSEKDKIGRAHV